MRFLSKLFGRRGDKGPEELPRPRSDSVESAREAPAINQPTRIGNRYDVLRVFGEAAGHGGVFSGMGIVFLVHDRETGAPLALKTYQDRYFADPHIRDAFQREALAWVRLERHPHIVRAHWVDSVNDRLFIALELISGDADGRNRLTQFLGGQPLPLKQLLIWSIQCCLGLEHAYSKGLVCHRDIKPDNLMIDAESNLRVTDFGLAVSLDTAPSGTVASELPPTDGARLTQVRVEKGFVCGTPGYIAPEILAGEGADIRSDVFSFGVVLRQMVSGSRAPLKDINRDGPLAPLLAKCLAANPNARYSSFSSLRSDLEVCLESATGHRYTPSVCEDLQAWEITNQGVAFEALDRLDDAVAAFDRALALNPRDSSAWNNKGKVLRKLGRDAAAAACYEQAITINPRYGMALFNRANQLLHAKNPKEALVLYDRAVESEPSLCRAWANRGAAQAMLGRHAESIVSWNTVLQMDPNDFQVTFNKGQSLKALTRYQEARVCFLSILSAHEAPKTLRQMAKEQLETLPKESSSVISAHIDQMALGDKCMTEQNPADAIGHYTIAIEVDPKNKVAHHNRGVAYRAIGKMELALKDLSEAIRLDPEYVMAYWNRGNVQRLLNRAMDAIHDFTTVIKLAPGDSKAFANRAEAWGSIGRWDQAIPDFEHVIKLEPRSVQGYLNLGTARNRAGDWSGAIRDYSLALDIDPECVDALNFRAYAKTRVGDDTGAISDWSVALRIRPNDSVMLHNRGLARKRIGDTRGADEDAWRSKELS